MVAEHLSRVFDSFFSSKTTKETGLGLFISQPLVGHGGGTLTVCGASGQRPEFVLYLPASLPGDG